MKQWFLKIGRSLLGFVLACLVLLNTGGYWMVYQGLDAYLYLQHQQGMPNTAGNDAKANPLSLTFAKADLAGPNKPLTWIEEQEFRYNGGMYDVHERQESPDSVTFLVERDRAEERLEALFFGEKGTNQKPVAGLGWVHLVIVKGLCHEPTHLLCFQPSWQKHTCYARINANHQPQPHTPPPAV